ncbi:MAG TPA: hypothetical protein VEI27_01860 [Dehalococcoidales bacterium]|nr:hypothetical protein [Dehalococcoidales bacterium]
MYNVPVRPQRLIRREVIPTRRPYRILGLGLITAGAVFGPLAYYLLHSVPLTGVGLSAVILGFIAIALGNSRPAISQEAGQLIFQTGTQNTTQMLATLGLHNRAIYFPSALTGGKPLAVISRKENNPATLLVSQADSKKQAAFEENAVNDGYIVSTPGTVNFEMLGIKTGFPPPQIEESLTHALVGMLDLANSVRADVTEKIVEVNIDKPSLIYEDNPYCRCLGSPIASIVAAIVCEGLGKPVRIKKEKVEHGKSHIVLEILSVDIV